MSIETIQSALTMAEDTDELIIAPGAIEKSAEVIRRVFSGRKAVIVADENTWRAAAMLVRSV